MKRLILIALLVALPLVLVAVRVPASTSSHADDVRNASDGLTVHEWGTFTTVAGPSGKAVEWLPLGDSLPLGSGDLPCFVDHLTGFSEKYQLSALVRMETPVLYFYSARDTKVNVNVGFPTGLITEWFPKASKVGPAKPDWRQVDGAIQWNNIAVTPSAAPDFPSGNGKSHYYAARNTDASPIEVNGQKEKFLFYRGIGNIPATITAKIQDDGRIRIENQTRNRIDGMILFHNQNGRMGFRTVPSPKDVSVLDPPELTSNFEALRPELESMLTRAGLYDKEAKAMVETWRDSWFEEGTRVLYIVPAKAVDAALPLKIEPKPEKVARAFVGRMEVITPEMMKEVKAAALKNDRKELARYGRFLDPITRAILAEPMAAEDVVTVKANSKSVRDAYFAKQRTCGS